MIALIPRIAVNRSMAGGWVHGTPASILSAPKTISSGIPVLIARHRRPPSSVENTGG
jgi:hypothetical protein